MAITFVCKWFSKYKLLVCCAKKRIRVRLKVWVRLTVLMTRLTCIYINKNGKAIT